MRPLFDPAEFRLPAGVAHVCAAGETPFLHRHDAALARYAHDKSQGMPGRTAQEAEVERARELAARLWHVAPGDIGFVSSVADGVAMVADSLDWQLGDNMVIDANEYPSVVLPFALRRQPKIELRVATGTAPDRVAALVDARTRVIGVSYVSYLTGERFDLDALRKRADQTHSLLVVDFTQAAGYLPIAANVADFAFSATYKWLLGTTGTALAYWNRTRQPAWEPHTGGWHSLAPVLRPDYPAGVALKPDAMRFTRGNPAHGPVYVLASALDYLLQHDQDAIASHVTSLTADLLNRLKEAGIPSTTPSDPARHGGNVCIDSPNAQAIVDSLYRQGVYAWNGHGRARFSFHGYNGSADIDRIMTGLRQIWT